MTHTVDESGSVWAIVPPIETMVAPAEGTPFGNMTYGGGPATGFNGYVKQGINSGPFNSATPGYIGKSFPSAAPVSKVIIYGPVDRGYVNTGVAQSVTIELYGKVGSPSGATDGTLLGSITFTQSTTNESTGRTITSSDTTTDYTHVWVRINGGAGNSTEMSQLQIWRMFKGPPAAYLDYIKPCFIGDSIVANMGGLKSAFPAPFNGLRSLGISGATMANAGGGIGYIPGEVSSIAVGDTDIYIGGGTNDLLGLNSDAGIVPGYTAILNSAQMTGRRVVVLGIPQVDEAQLDISHPGYKTNLNNARIATVNGNVNGLSPSFPGVIFATAWQNLSMVGRTGDGIHPTLAGYLAQIAALPQ